MKSRRKSVINSKYTEGRRNSKGGSSRNMLGRRKWKNERKKLVFEFPQL